MLKIFLTYKKYVIYVIIILAFIWFANDYIKQIKEKKRFESNYNTVVNSNSNAEILHYNEVKKYHFSIDSLRNELNIRKKTVVTVFQTKYNYKDSTILIPKVIINQINDTLKIIKEYSYTSDCYDLNIYNSNDTLLHYLNYKDRFTGFVHWERSKKFWFIHYGHKQYYLKLYSDCKKDTIKVDKLILIE